LLPEVQIHPGFDWLPRLVVVSKPYLTSLRWIVLALAASLLFFCASNSAQIRLSGLDTQIRWLLRFLLLRTRLVD